jgi:UDP-2,4-diacetamido-2,4,6-trideoxy-beta-L-altropyranose hydrolase
VKASEPVLMIRADASVAIATGHAMRCLALAQAWQDTGGRAVFAMAESVPAIDARVASERIEAFPIKESPGTLADATCTAELAGHCNAAWIVADGYHFGSEYQHRLKNSGSKLLFLDDNGHAGHYVADVVLNQNPHASESLYANRESYTRLLLGPGYALLRREFRASRDWKRAIPKLGRRVLVTLGGTDPDNVTLGVINGLRNLKINGFEALIVVGGGNPHFKSLAATATGDNQIRLVRDAVNMPELMAWADVAIAGAGATCWEMCLLGVPALLVSLAPNQLQIAQWLDQKGVGCHIGSTQQLSSQAIACKLESLLRDSETRARMSRRGRKLVDGTGALKVTTMLKNHE